MFLQQIPRYKSNSSWQRNSCSEPDQSRKESWRSSKQSKEAGWWKKAISNKSGGRTPCKATKVGENVERNERQIKHLKELKQGICLINTWYPSGEL